MDFLTPIFAKVFSVLMAIFSLIGFNMPGKEISVKDTEKKTDYAYIFVCGFWGWGEYDEINDALPYWGLTTGDMMESLNKSGFNARAASVDPVGSAWDRACELYAQLTGTRVDYGEAHSEKYGHDRYGEDYTGKALLEKWSSEDKINIIDHSFGGPTCALMASILENGARDEIERTTDGSLSPYFEGGKGDYIYSITSFAGAFRGTTLIVNSQAVSDLLASIDSDVNSSLPTLLPGQKKLVSGLIGGVSKVLQFATSGKVAAEDTALYDMHPDNSRKLFEDIDTVDGVYYFTVPHCATKDSEDGTYQVGDLSIADYSFWPLSNIIGRTNTVTEGGIVLDEKWQKNDGLVNTISAYAPEKESYNEIGRAPSVELAESGFEKGVYNVFETYSGSHMALMGNIMRPNKEALPYIAELMQMINAL